MEENGGRCSPVTEKTGSHGPGPGVCSSATGTGSANINSLTASAEGAGSDTIGQVDKDISHSMDPPIATPCNSAALRRNSSNSRMHDIAMDPSDDGPPDDNHPVRDVIMDSSDDGEGVATSTGDLPDEVLEHLLTFVPPYEDLRSCRLVSRRWYRAVKRVERKLRRLLSRCVDELNVAWFHYDTPNPVASDCRTITKRCAHSAAMLAGRMYVFGGCSSRMTSFNDLWWLEPGLLTWHRPPAVGSYPSPKAYASMVAHGESLVVFGGWSQAAPYPLHQSWRLFDELHIYDTKESRWREVRGVSSASSPAEPSLPGAPLPPPGWPPAMARHAASVHGREMVVTGGLHHHGNSRFSATNEVWVFDLESEQWRHQRCSQPAPSARYGHSQVALDDAHMLLIGGSGGPNQLRQDCWLLELGAPTAEWRWRQLSVAGADSAPQQLWCHPACQVGDKVVVLGRGRDDTGSLSLAAARPLPAAPAPAPAPAAQPGGRPALAVPIAAAVPPTGRPAVPPGRPAAAVRGPSSAPQPVRGPETGFLSRRTPPPPPPPASPSQPRPSVRPNASSSRERRLAGLLRAQQRLAAASAVRAAPALRPRCRAPLTAGYRLITPAGRRPLAVHVLDTALALSEARVGWRQSQRRDGPDERILYSLVAGRGELVMFGGIVTPPRAAEAAADPELEQNATFNAVSLVAIPCDMFR